MTSSRCLRGAALLLLLACPRGFAQIPFDFRQTLIALDRSANPVLFTSSTSGGPFRSSDGGLTWTPMALTERGLPQPRIEVVVADPNNPAVVYAAGDVARGGVWKSKDKGESWSRASAGLPEDGGQVSQLFLPPASPGIAYARVAGAIYKSTDGGGSWALRATLPCTSAFSMSLQTPSLMFCAKGSAIYRSLDEGATWTIAGAIQPQWIGRNNSTSGIADLQADPWNPAVVYASVRGGLLWVGGESIIGLYRSADRGMSWTNIAPDTQVFHITVDPGGRSTLYYTYPESNSVCRAGSPGAGWKCVAVGPLGGGEIRIAVSPANSNLIYAAASGGVYKSQDGGDTWQRLAGAFRPTLGLPDPPLHFSLQAGSQGLRVWEVSALENAKAPLAFTFSTSGESWLSISPASGSTRAAATVRVSAASLAPGTYAATIRVSAPEAANNDAAIPVKLTVTEVPPATSYYTVDAYAGTGTAGFAGDGGAASSAQFHSPAALAFDAPGNLFVADSGNHCVRRIAPDGTIQTVAGTGQFGFSGDGGSATASRLWRPEGLAIDSAGNLFIADTSNSRIRKVTPAGIISTIAGRDTAVLSSLFRPRGMAFDAGRNLVIADGIKTQVQRLAPTGYAAASLGQALSWPSDVAVDGAGNLLVADRDHHRICRISPAGVVTTVAGSGTAGFQGDGGPAEAAWLYRPEGVAVDAAGTIYIADSGNHRVRAVSPAGIITTLAGTGERGSAGTGGPGSAAQLRWPSDIAVDASGNIYVADEDNHRIVKLARRALQPPSVRPEGIVSAGSLAGTAAPGSLVIIAGENLAAASGRAESVPWPTALAGAVVRINGVAAPLSFAGPSQINAQVPVELAPGPATLTVSADSIAGWALTSAPAALTLSSAAPAIMIAENRAVAWNENGSRNSAENPAAPGSLMTVYLTGQGPVDNPVESGRAAREDPPSRAILPYAAALGDQEAEVLYIELVPGEVGLARAIVRIPSLPSGDHPLVITIDGVASRPAVISVQGNE